MQWKKIKKNKNFRIMQSLFDKKKKKKNALRLRFRAQRSWDKLFFFGLSKSRGRGKHDTLHYHPTLHLFKT